MTNAKKMSLLIILITLYIVFAFIIRHVKWKILDPKGKVLLVTSIRPKPCLTQKGDEINEQGYQNKRQYAQLMNYDLIYNRRYLDTHLNITGTYTKISLLRELLVNESDSTNRHEWFLWMDADLIINDMSFELPFEKYINYDLVIWGDVKEIFVGHHGVYGTNTGVFLLRNTKWSLQFIELVREFGINHGLKHEDKLKPFIREYQTNIYEQNAIVYILNQNPKLRSRIYFERVIGFNRYWKDYIGIPNWNPFVIHFMGCQFCAYQLKNDCVIIWDEFLKKSLFSYKSQLSRFKLNELKP